MCNAQSATEKQSKFTAISANKARGSGKWQRHRKLAVVAAGRIGYGQPLDGRNEIGGGG